MIPGSKWNVLLIAMLCLTCKALSQTQNTSTLHFSGNLSLVSRSDIIEPAPENSFFEHKKLDYTSISNLSMRLNKFELSVKLSKPTFYTFPNQPDKYFTVELKHPYFALRYGDLMPELTQNITGYNRIHGAEAKLKLGDWVELSTVYGKSKNAVSAKGYIPGNYSQTFYAHRLKFIKLDMVNIGFSIVKMQDAAQSMDFSASLFKPKVQDNLIIGSDVTFKFFTNKTLTLEYAAAIFNSDQSAPITKNVVKTDSKMLDWIVSQNVFMNQVTLNDSASSGELIGAKLVFPISTFFINAEYRRASKRFMSLATPYEQSDNERIRVNTSSNLFSNLLSIYINGEYNRSNISKTQSFSNFRRQLYTSVSVNPQKFGRITLNFQKNDMYNDASPPADKFQWDQRQDASFISGNLSYTKTHSIGKLNFWTTLSLSGNLYKDNIRTSSGYNSYSVQATVNSSDNSQYPLNFQCTFTQMYQSYSDSRQKSVQFLYKQAYNDYKVMPYISAGVNASWNTVKPDQMNEMILGAGVKWIPKPQLSFDIEWQWKGYVDSYNNYLQHIIDIKTNYIF